MSLETNWQMVFDSSDPGVPDHLGFSMRVVATLIEAKQERTTANIAAARKALQDQIAGRDGLEEAIQQAIDESRQHKPT